MSRVPAKMSMERTRSKPPRRARPRFSFVVVTSDGCRVDAATTEKSPCDAAQAKGFAALFLQAAGVHLPVTITERDKRCV